MARTTFVLTGRIGNGKSSTGNSILGEKLFKPQSSHASVPAGILERKSDKFGTPVTVVDGLDIDDVDFDKRKNIKSLCDQAKRNLSSSMSEESISAIVLVLKYGVRFTRQEKKAVDFIRSMFGKNVLKTYGIIVMSHGDNFDLDKEDRNYSFKTWCAEQTGEVRDLFQEIQSRIVLFNNKTTDFEAQKQQFLQLMEKVPTGEKPYSKKELLTSIDTFRKNKKSKEKKKKDKVPEDTMHKKDKKMKKSKTCHIL